VSCTIGYCCLISLKEFFLRTKYNFLRSNVGPLNYFFVPIVLVAFMSYFVVDLFLQVYEMAVDTIFMCFLQDLEVSNPHYQNEYFRFSTSSFQHNDGSKGRPYFMPVSLQVRELKMIFQNSKSIDHSIYKLAL